MTPTAMLSVIIAFICISGCVSISYAEDYESDFNDKQSCIVIGEPYDRRLSFYFTKNYFHLISNNRYWYDVGTSRVFMRTSLMYAINNCPLNPVNIEVVGDVPFLSEGEVAQYTSKSNLFISGATVDTFNILRERYPDDINVDIFHNIDDDGVNSATILGMHDFDIVYPDVTITLRGVILDGLGTKSTLFTSKSSAPDKEDCLAGCDLLIGYCSFHNYNPDKHLICARSISARNRAMIVNNHFHHITAKDKVVSLISFKNVTTFDNIYIDDSN
jgi:hypothetical protein